MIVDNLKDINSQADLFQYISNVETELEDVKKHRDLLLAQLGVASGKISDLEHKLADTQHMLDFYASKLTTKGCNEND